MRVWRLVKPESLKQHEKQEKHDPGGRWNSAGTTMIYAASSLALAALEVYVNLPHRLRRSGLFPPFTAFGFDVPDDLILVSGVPDDGDCKRAGDAWLLSARSPALQVPSAVIPRETNVLMNPDHPDFEKIRLLVQEPFEFDDRMSP
jgi:RES domain-containing protein